MEGAFTSCDRRWKNVEELLGIREPWEADMSFTVGFYKWLKLIFEVYTQKCSAIHLFE